MRETKALVPPGEVRASEAAARFSLDINARSSISRRLSTLPTARRELVFFRRSISASEMVISSSSGCPLSSMTIAVISLVIEAIDIIRSVFLPNSTSPVWALTTRAALECSRGTELAASCISCSGWARTRGLVASSMAVSPDTKNRDNMGFSLRQKWPHRGHGEDWRNFKRI